MLTILCSDLETFLEVFFPHYDSADETLPPKQQSSQFRAWHEVFVLVLDMFLWSLKQQQGVSLTVLRMS